jgi:hypothetical protein
MGLEIFGFSQILYDANERVEIRRKSSFRLESRTRDRVFQKEWRPP